MPLPYACTVICSTERTRLCSACYATTTAPIFSFVRSLGTGLGGEQLADEATLPCTMRHHATLGGEQPAEGEPRPATPTGTFVRESNFMTTSRMLGLFATGGKKASTAWCIVR